LPAGASAAQSFDPRSELVCIQRIMGNLESVPVIRVKGKGRIPKMARLVGE